MKHLFLLSTFALLTLAVQHASAADMKTITAEPLLTCSNTVINTIYLPKMREVADWPDSQLRPYAKQLCQLDKQTAALQLSIKNRADQLRTTNWRICKEVIPGNPNPTPADCQAAYAKIINDLIDHCISVVNIGHDPHNVQLLIDPAQTEVSCLKGVNTAIQ